MATIAAMQHGHNAITFDRRRVVAGLAALAASSFAANRISAQAGHAEPPRQVWSPLDFGAHGDGHTMDTAAIQQAIESCAQAGGGRVVLDAGRTFVSGTLSLRSHVELHLAPGSVLRASGSRDAFRELGALLFAKDSEDIHLSGTGTIDGNFAAFFPPKGPDGYPVPQPFLGPYDPLYGPSMRNPPDGRPRIILLVNCRNTLLEQFTIRDSPTWTVHLLGCEGLHIQGISILNGLDVPNCDGIDIDHCRQVRIEGCNIVAGDDCLVLKASRNFGQYGPCEGVTITGCTLESASAGIKVEPEGPFPVRSVVVSNCTILRSNRGISVLNRDGATVEDLLFTGMTIETRMRPLMWWGSGEPIAVSSVPREAGGPVGLVRNIAFTDILCRGESGVYFRGFQQVPLQDIALRQVTILVEKTTTYTGGFHDMRPGELFGPSGLDRRDIAGVFAADIAGLLLSDVSVRWAGQPTSYFGSALELHRCREVSLAQVLGKAAHPGALPALFDEVTFDRGLAPSASSQAGQDPTTIKRNHGAPATD